MADHELIHYERQLSWENGKPKVIGVPAKFNEQADFTLRELLRESLNLPYSGVNPEYKGLTKGEALIIDLVTKASDGDEKARSEVLDRLMGKSVQNIKSLSLKGTLGEFLDSVHDTIDVEGKQTPDDVESL